MLNTSEDPNWWVAKAKGGKEGMIPANYVELLPDGVGKLERCVLIYILCHSRSEVCECVQNFRISCLGAGRLVLACCQAHPSLYDAFGCRPLLLVSSLIYIYIFSRLFPFFSLCLVVSIIGRQRYQEMPMVRWGQCLGFTGKLHVPPPKIC